MITCAANGCPSTQTTKIDGNQISFFPFPDDNPKKNQWLHNCNLASGIVNDKKPLHLCELHFDKINFTASRDLKANSVPTLFGRIEEPPKKLNKIENVLQKESQKESSKQKKVDEHSHTLVTPPQSPFMQDNIEDTIRNKANVLIEKTVTVNGSAVLNSVLNENVQTNTNKTYRLIIQIDKIQKKTGSKSKNAMPLVMLNNEPCAKLTNVQNKKFRPLFIRKSCAPGGCKLRRCVYNSRLAFQCELCNKYYITKKEQVKNYSCTVCKKTFPNPHTLYTHIRGHFTCDICQTGCISQASYDKHVRLHVTTDSLRPYKCHQCKKTFELKESAKQHCLEHPKMHIQKSLLQVSPPIAAIISPQNDYRCMKCNINFKSNQEYRNHISSHGKKEGLSCNISETNKIIPVPNPLTGSQIGILQAVKFSCRVCSKEFDNVGEVDLHTRTHLDTEDELKCNICKRIFKNSMVFSEHLKQHLARAHPCPICSKAFINKTTLKIHLKTHSKS